MLLLIAREHKCLTGFHGQIELQHDVGLVLEDIFKAKRYPGCKRKAKILIGVILDPVLAFFKILKSRKFCC